jgi:hypothetical protein
MIFTVGWHYTKQTFGCVMVYAHFDSYTLTPDQRTITRRALLAMWVLAFVDQNRDGSWRTFNVFSYSSLDLPDAAVPLALLAVVVGLVLVAHRVVLANYRQTGRLPGPNLVVSFLAIYVWWLPLTRQPEFFFLLAPLFHSVQYLAFVYRVEAGHLAPASHQHLRGAAFALGLVAAGWLAFEAMPSLADAAFDTMERLRLPFFLIAATLFINIHHYFIDNVIWRFSDPDVRRYLLGAPDTAGGA